MMITEVKIRYYDKGIFPVEMEKTLERKGFRTSPGEQVVVGLSVDSLLVDMLQ